MNRCYFLTMRPPTPFSMPIEGLLNVEEYPDRTYIPEILHEAYAKLTYNRELMPDEISNYELLPDAYEVQLTRSELRFLSEALKEWAIEHNGKANESYGMYKKFRKVLEG